MRMLHVAHQVAETVKLFSNNILCHSSYLPSNATECVADGVENVNVNGNLKRTISIYDVVNGVITLTIMWVSVQEGQLDVLILGCRGQIV